MLEFSIEIQVAVASRAQTTDESVELNVRAKWSVHAYINTEQVALLKILSQHWSNDVGRTSSHIIVRRKILRTNFLY